MRINRFTQLRVLAALCFGLAAAIFAVAPVRAHERVEVGPYVIVVGWEAEPVVVGERNALLLIVTEDGEPVEGLEATVDVAVAYGGHSYTGNLAPAAQPGVYRAEIWPTVRGQYEVHLTGAIGDESLDIVVEPEEVLSAATLQFPETQPSPRDLQTSIDELDSRLQTAFTVAIAGVVVGVLGLTLGVIALRRGRD